MKIKSYETPNGMTNDMPILGLAWESREKNVILI
jgi:hypothetical protein